MEKKTKLPLDVELLQVGDYLFGRIKDQDEALRLFGVAFEHDGIKIIGGGSNGAPQLYKESCKCTTLYIRGTAKSADYTTFMAKYASEKEASKWADKLVAAINEFNKDPSHVQTKPTEPLKCKRIMG